MEFKYSAQQIQNILDLLNGLTIKGVDSASKVLQIVQILNNPVKDVKVEEDESKMGRN